MCACMAATACPNYYYDSYYYYNANIIEDLFFS